MALSNESYIVQTATSGEVIVPIREAVQYMNVTFIGYQYYSYHTLMSQNMANLADDIKALQDGGLAQATFDLDALIQAAKDDIDLQILGIEAGLNDKIIFLTDEAVFNTNTKLANFDLELHGDGVNTFGIAGDIINLMGSSTGMLDRLTIIETAVGDENSGGLVQQFNGITGIVTDLAVVVGSSVSGLVEDVLILEGKMDNVATGVVPRLTIIEALLGDLDSGLVNQVGLNKDVLFGDASYDGLYNIVGDNTSGLVKYAQDNRTLVNDLNTDAGNRLTSIEFALGHLANTGLTSDVHTLQTTQQTIRTNLGDTDATGLRRRVSLIEALSIQSIRDTVYGDGATIDGLVSDSNGLRTDLDTLIASSTSYNGNTNTALALLDSKININIDDIVAIEDTMTTKIAELDTVKANLNDAGTGVNAQLLNMNNKIKTDLLTYTNGGNTLLFTPTVLNNMKNTTDSLDVSDIISQFQTYFGTPGNYIPSVEVGALALNDWIDDVGAATGYKKSTEAIIDAHLGSGSGMTQVTENKNAITLLNSNDAIVGSVANTVLQSSDAINESIYGATGSVTILNSNGTVNGSVAHSINEGIVAYNATLQANTISDLNDQITALENENIELQQDIKDTASELQVEMVRYDTILPFLQSMFKRVNNDGEILDSEIDTIFNTVSGKVAALSTTLVNKDATIYFTDNGGGGLNTFDVSIKLDSDLKFADLTSLGEDVDVFLIIDRVSDGYQTTADLNSTTLDAANNLVIDSGIYLEIMDARVYANPADTTGVEVLDLTETYNVTYATTDIFGQLKIHTTQIEVRP